jgi:SecD/SecF fusion protein
VVLLPILSLLLFGGDTLKNFAFAMFVGVATGAYSSIFIAAPVLTILKGREARYRQLEARRTVRESRTASRTETPASASAAPAAGAGDGEEVGVAAASSSPSASRSTGPSRPRSKSKRRPPAKRRRR